MGTTVMPTSTLSSKRSETPTEESAVDTLMLMPMESSNRFSTLLMELDSVLLTPVCLLLQSMMELLPPSTPSHLLPPHSTQFSQLTPLRLLRPRLLILLLLPLLLLLLRGRGVRLILLSLMDLELLTQLMPMAMLVCHMLLVCPMLLPMAMLVLAMVCLTMVRIFCNLYLTVLCV